MSGVNVFRGWKFVTGPFDSTFYFILNNKTHRNGNINWKQQFEWAKCGKLLCNYELRGVGVIVCICVYVHVQVYACFLLPLYRLCVGDFGTCNPTLNFCWRCCPMQFYPEVYACTVSCAQLLPWKMTVTSLRTVPSRANAKQNRS